MSYFAVIREAGPGWKNGGIDQQPGVGDHAGYMNTLSDRGLVLFAGPLAGTEGSRLRALLVFNAHTEAEVERCLADDPWARTSQLQITSIEPWTLFVGAERLQAMSIAVSASV